MGLLRSQFHQSRLTGVQPLSYPSSLSQLPSSQHPSRAILGAGRPSRWSAQDEPIQHMHGSLGRAPKFLQHRSPQVSLSLRPLMVGGWGAYAPLS